MQIKNIYKQAKGKWIDYIEFIVFDVGDPVPAEHGFSQKITIVDRVGTEAEMTYYPPDEQFFMDDNYEGKQCAFRIRHKEGGFLQGYPVEEPTEKPLEVIDWDVINFGKCRHGILCKCINSIEDAKKIKESVAHQRVISQLAHFSMFGTIE